MNLSGSKILHGLLLATSGLVGSTLIASTAAMAGGGPTGGTVAVGSATIVNASPTQTVVNQSSNKALINWNSFSIPGGSSVKFNQPNSKSLTVNRVTGPNASTIDGALLANGNVWLINANGIIFGKGSQINVGALLATTSDLNDDDFKSGNYSFKPAANANAAVVNKGTITAGANGSVILSAPRVSNEGLIQANLGTVVLGGANAFTVDMTGDNLLRYQITAPVADAQKDANGSVASALVSNSGTIMAAGGHVMMTARAARNVEDNVINNTGIVEATTVSSHNGVIDLDAGPDGTVNDSGTLDVSGTGQGQTGGAVNVTGGTVNVADGATINASGNAGGGTIQIGGGLHGQGTLAHAQRTIIGAATISADATGKGNGGTVAVWSDGQTSFAGSISAKGGAQGGNGGQVETSGQNLGVTDSAQVDTSAPLGLTGDWLLDPPVGTIQPTHTIESNGGNSLTGATISASAITNALATSNVTLEATSLITVLQQISYNSANSLNLLSEGNLAIDASIQNMGSGAINLIAGWDGHTFAPSSFQNAGVYGNSNGMISIGGAGATGGVAIGSYGGITTIEGSGIGLYAVQGYTQVGYHNSGGGDIIIQALGGLTLSGNNATKAQIGNGASFGVAGTSGNITINAAAIYDSAGGDIAGNIATLTTSGGSIGSATAPLNLTVSALSVSASNASGAANAYLAQTAGDLALGANGQGINLHGGNLTLTGAGNITQSNAIVANAVNISTTSGNIVLTTSGNQVGTASLTATGNVSLTDVPNLTIASANVGGTLTLVDTGTIGQGGAITAATLVADGTSVTLTDTGNEIGTANLTATGDASLADTSALNISGADVGGTLTLISNGTIGQTGAITAATLVADGTSITLTDAGNEIGTANLTASGDASLYDVSALTVGGVNVTGNLTLVDSGTIGQNGTIIASTLTANGTSLTFTNSGNQIGTANLTASGNASLTDASNLTIASANVGSTLTLVDTGTIGQTGAITAGTLNANGTSLTFTNSGNKIGIANLTATGNASLYDASALTIAGANVGGTLTLVDTSTIGQTGAIMAGTLNANGTSLTFTNSGNKIGIANLTATGNASLYDASALTIAGANVGGTLTLVDTSTIGQTGAIMAGTLNANGTSLTFTNSGNQIGTANLTASGNASLTDASNLTIASANVGSTLTLVDTSTIGQTGAITAATLNANGTSLTFSNSSNKIGTANLTASGNASLYDASALTVGSANVGGTLTLVDTSTIGQTGAIMAGTLNANGTSLTFTNSGNKIGIANLTATGNASLYDASALTIAGANVGGTLTLVDTSTIGQTGAIMAGTLNANGTSLTFTNSGNQIGTANLTASGNASLTDASNLTIASANVGSTLTLVDTSTIGQTGAITAATLNANGTSLTFSNSSNKIGTANLTASGNASLYDASALTVGSAKVTGNLTLLGKGDLKIISSIQLTNGTILAAAGWDGITTDPALLVSGSAYGQNGGNIIIGGTGASGNVAVGSRNGTTTLLSDNLLLAAVNGYAQLGYHGSGTGAIFVGTTGNITLNGGSLTDRYSQIGDGGYQVVGSHSDAITLGAAGNVTLNGGSGQGAYAQIGNGGAQSNSNSNGYVNTGSIAVSGQKVILSAGSGAGSYAQIGNGGFKSGQSLAGTAIIGGDIAVNAINAVTLTGGGTNAYAQIGNAGDYTNYGAANGSSGTTSGNIAVVVSTPIGGIDPIILTAGSGAQSYVQIGNGGDFENVPAAGANVSFSVSGNVSVDDITIIGSNTGANSYGQIGNGDAAGTGTGNVSGNITISAGTNFTIVNGTAPGSSAQIANDTGVGTLVGNVSGYTAPPSSPLSDPSTAGSVANLVQASFVPNTAASSAPSIPSFDSQIETVHIDVSTTGALPYPLEQLAGGSYENNNSSDGAVEIAIDALFRQKTAPAPHVIIPGLLKEVSYIKTQAIGSVPPADTDYSSWGNEALWRW